MTINNNNEKMTEASVSVWISTNYSLPQLKLVAIQMKTCNSTGRIIGRETKQEDLIHLDRKENSDSAKVKRKWKIEDLWQDNEIISECIYSLGCDISNPLILILYDQREERERSLPSPQKLLNNNHVILRGYILRWKMFPLSWD